MWHRNTANPAAGGYHRISLVEDGVLGGWETRVLAEPIDFAEWIPIFPLPDVVLMPRAVLPLHIFEPRYREMMRDVLAGPRLMAIALLQPGYEARYHSLHVGIHPEVCVGRILREERHSDGRYSFLIQGLSRAAVVCENTERAYRRGRLRAIRPLPAQPDVECALRRELRALLRRPPLADLARRANWLELFNCPDFTFSDVLDVLASAVLPSAEEKQRFLAEPCVATRARCICGVIRTLADELARRGRRAERVRTWPPELCDN